MKPHLTIDEQVNHLKKRGLYISDETNFGLFLLNNNYYRVSGYFNPFLIEAEGEIQTYFKPGTSEIQIMQLFEFDRTLRNFLFEVLAIFETKFRSRLAYHAGEISPYVHLTGKGLAIESTSIRDGATESRFAEWTLGYEKALSDNAKNAIVLKHIEKYDGKLPIWAAVEILDLGKISSLFRMLEEPIAALVSKDFNLGASMFKSLVATLNDLRNQVAHQSRIWNLHYPMTPKTYKTKRFDELHHLALIQDYQRHKLFTRLSLLLWIEKTNSFNIDFKNRLFNLLRDLPQSDSLSYSSMGWSDEFLDSTLWIDFLPESS